uniref:Uncharacterized protein n=1 Tax=Anguilla anguilla TaxID=7936 RepID=A0A0E9V3R3_ANGAN
MMSVTYEPTLVTRQTCE